MNITKEESERILKSVQSNKVISVTLRKNDTQSNKKQELQSLVNSINTKITGGQELTLILIETH